MASLHMLLWALVAALVRVACGQDTTPSLSLDAFPDCALGCIVDGFQMGICSFEDTACTCTNQEFQSNVTACVTTTCSVIDALVTKNATATRCGAPIRDQTGELVRISASMGILAAIFVIIRLVCKLFVVKARFGMDDWFVFASTATMIPSIFINIYGTTASGLGKDIWTLPPDDITAAIKHFWVAIFLYFLETALTKLSIISFYINIFPSWTVLRVLWGTFAITCVWGFVYVVTAISQCQPVSLFWTRWDGMHAGHCASKDGIGWSHAIINIILDLWILAIPLSQLRGLQLNWKKKIGVAIMFSLGTFVTIVSMVRLESLVHFTSSTNVTWTFYDLSRWSTVEITLGIVCACLPAARLLLVRLFPAMGGSSLQRQKSSTYHFRTNNNVTNVEEGWGNTAGVVGAGRQSLETIESPGIAYHRAYAVHNNENEEDSLFRLHSIRAHGRRF